MNKRNRYLALGLVLLSYGILNAMSPSPEDIARERLRALHERMLSPPTDLYLYPSSDDIGKTMQMFFLLTVGDRVVPLVPEATEAPDAKFEIEGDIIYKVVVPWREIQALSVVTNPETDEVSVLTRIVPDNEILDLRSLRRIGSIDEAPYNTKYIKNMIPYRE